MGGVDTVKDSDFEKLLQGEAFRRMTEILLYGNSPRLEPLPHQFYGSSILDFLPPTDEPTKDLPSDWQPSPVPNTLREWVEE